METKAGFIEDGTEDCGKVVSYPMMVTGDVESTVIKLTLVTSRNKMAQHFSFLFQIVTVFVTFSMKGVKNICFE